VIGSRLVLTPDKLEPLSPPLTDPDDNQAGLWPPEGVAVVGAPAGLSDPAGPPAAPFRWERSPAVPGRSVSQIDPAEAVARLAPGPTDESAKGDR
jgi:hypothetical protein